MGNVYVGLRIQGAALAAKSNTQVFFNRSESAVIPAGGTVESDPVPMKILAWQDLAVSNFTFRKRTCVRASIQVRSSRRI